MDLQLQEKRIVITGASKGIGLALVERFLAEGARVVAASRRPSVELERLAGDALVHVSADLTQPDAPAEVVARAAAAFGGLDVLVNNVGGVLAPRASFAGISDADWHATLEFNLLSAVRAIRAALPLLLERPGSSVINISSVNGRRPAPSVLDYAVAKAGLTTLTKGLSEELAPQGVRFNTISPGPTRTPFWTADGGMGDLIAGQAGVDRDTALATVLPEMMQLSTGRMVGPEEVAGAAALLASPLAGNVTGTDIAIDAGFLKNH